jgi:hypothetical protein
MKKSNIIQELSNERNKEDKTKGIVLKKIFDLSIKSIKLDNSLGVRHTLFTVPMFMIGYPLYDIDEMTKLITKKLSKQDFKTKIIKTDTIYIKW